jgi:hypothetical protein
MANSQSLRSQARRLAGSRAHGLQGAGIVVTFLIFTFAFAFAFGVDADRPFLFDVSTTVAVNATNLAHCKIDCMLRGY